MVDITIWLTLGNINISNNNRSSTFYVYVFFPLSLPRLLSNLTVDMSNTVVSYKKRDLPTRREHTSSPRFCCWGPCCSWFKFLLCPMMYLYVLNSALWNMLRFLHEKQFSVRLYPQLFPRDSRLIFVICVCVHIVVSNIYCVVCMFCFSWSCVLYITVFSGLSMFDCTFGILYLLSQC